MKLTYGPGGWVRVEDQLHVAYLRFADDRTVADMVIEGGSRGVSPSALRSIPLRRYIAAALARPDLLFGWGMYEAPGVQPFKTSVRDSLMAAGGVFGFASRALMSPRARVTLAPPVDVALTDAFLRDVAAAYLDAVRHDERPNIALAGQSGHPRRTVERWVYLARKRGFLPPARAGRDG